MSSYDRNQANETSYFNGARFQGGCAFYSSFSCQSNRKVVEETQYITLVALILGTVKTQCHIARVGPVTNGPPLLLAMFT